MKTKNARSTGPPIATGAPNGALNIFLSGIDNNLGAGAAINF